MAEPAIAARERAGVSYDEHAAVVSEMHHRIKGNLQAIISIFSLQARHTANLEVRTALQQMQNRVRAVANLHEPLFGLEDFSAILFNEYLKRLTGDLEDFYEMNSRVRLELSLSDLALDINSALPLALIGNELLSNAFRHGFPGNRTGTISVQLRYSAQSQNDELEYCELTVADNGIGLPPGIELSTAETVGFHVVRLLTRQLRGKVEAGNGSDGGVTVKLSFPLPKETPEQNS